MSEQAVARPRLFGLSFRAKVTALALVSTMASVGIALTAFVFQAWMADRAAFASARIDLARTAALHAQMALRTQRPELANEAVEDFRRTRDLKSATFFTADGRSFLHWGGGRANAGSLDFVSLTRATAAYHGGRLEVHAPIVDGDAHLGEVVLISGEAPVTRRLARNAAIGAGLFALATMVAGLLAYWLSGRAIQPLRRLAAGMEQVRRTKDFTRLVEPGTTDEFGWLTARFNALLSELDTNDSALRLALEELTVARDAADAANVMKSQFLANMSHEIRTPLNGVLGMAQVMALNPLDAGQKERLDTIRRSGEALLAILNDLLDLSKVEAGKMEIEEAPFDVAGSRRAPTPPSARSPPTRACPSIS